MTDFNESDDDLESGNSETGQQGQDSDTSQSFAEQLSDDDKKLVGDKGWKTPSDMLKSYRELEKSFSTRVALPKDEDNEAWTNLYNKLGMPEKVEDYVIEGVDENVKADIQQILFKNHILPKDVKGLIADYNAFATSQAEKLKEQADAIQQQELEEVKTSWGDNCDKNREIAKRGAELLGLQEDDLNSIENLIGTKKFLLSMLKLGEAISEDSIGVGKRTGREDEELDLVEFYKQLK